MGVSDFVKVAYNGSLIHEAGAESVFTLNTSKKWLAGDIEVEVGSIPLATLISKSITQNGTYKAEDDSADGYSQVIVSVAGGPDTSDATLSSGAQMLYGITAYASGVKYTGAIQTYSGSVNGQAGSIPFYSGAYNITPSTTEQILSTSGKVMSDDMVIGSYSNSGLAISSPLMLVGNATSLGSILDYNESLERLIPEMYFPNVTSIPDWQFNGYASLEKIDFPVCSSIGAEAFCYLEYLSDISFPMCQYIGMSAFLQCTTLPYVSFSLCSIMEDDAFAGCSSISYASFPVCTSIGMSAFAYCLSLATISFPLLSDIGSEAFEGCYNLASVILPSCPYIHYATFSECYNISYVSLPICSYIESYAFASCSSLTAISLPACTSIEDYAFNGCASLSSLYLMGSEKCILEDTQAFYDTLLHFENDPYIGRIYVPSSLLTAYKTDSIWSYYESGFVGV